MGSKIEAKALMRAAGVPVLPDSSVEGAGDIGAVGFPLLVKASAGGGGRGMRIVREPGELDAALEAAPSARRRRRSATARCSASATSNGAATSRSRCSATRTATVVALHERECSIQRRHQKIIEESPSPAVDADLRAAMTDAAVAAAQAVGYVGAGTVEFLLEPDGRFSFLEMNTRLQVEHPVTEAITGLDLVELAADGRGGRTAAARAVRRPDPSATPSRPASRPRTRPPATAPPPAPSPASTSPRPHPPHSQASW